MGSERIRRLVRQISPSQEVDEEVLKVFVAIMV